MLDSTTRPMKDALLAPLARGPVGRVHPLVVSGLGLVASIGAAVAAWQGAIVLSIALWILGRTLDGLDGVLARTQGRQSDLGGLLDFLFGSGRATCKDASDANDDGAVGIADAIAILGHLFAISPGPTPLGECTVDGSLDALDCQIPDDC